MLSEKQSTAIDLRQELRYRRPATVRKIFCYRGLHGLNSFPVCPTCDITMEREYQSYCDRCGQMLSWKDFEKAVVILPK